jgi:endo-1,4-beta-xylanase
MPRAAQNLSFVRLSLPLAPFGHSLGHALALLGALTLGSGCIPKKKAESSAPSSAPSAPPPPQNTQFNHSAALSAPSLSASYARLFPIGAAMEPTQIGVVGDLVAHHFARLTAENAMKLGQICARPECNYGAADTLAAFAREHHMQMTGHAFVWHQMYPAWFFKDGDKKATISQISERLRAHIFQMTERYADVIDNWDVVNEAISDSLPKTYRDGAEGSVWYEAYGGPGYIRAAFEFAQRAAEAHDPTVKLYYNDYNVVRPEKRKKIIEMVRELRASGVRVDGVGMQAHWNIEWPSAAEIDATIKELAAENLLVKVSELDVSVYAQDNHDTKVWQAAIADSPELQQRLAARYKEIFRVFQDNAKVLDHVTFWGVTDERSWLNYWPSRRNNYPLLFDARHEPKPAFHAVLEIARDRTDER